MSAARDFLIALAAASSVALAFTLFAGCFTPKSAKLCVELSAPRDAGADR